MDVRLLGPVAVLAAGRAVDVGPPQRCAVLAALAVDAGRQVAVETLIDRVWGEQSPDRARRALHAHVTRIRRAFDQAGAGGERPEVLLRRPGGYLLDLDPERVDLHRFRRLCERAREQHRTAAERVALLAEALRLWQGEPLPGVTGDWAARTRQAWQQQHVDAVLAWARAEVRGGDPSAVVAPLTDLAGEHPLLEPLVVVLMRALYLAGNPIRALELYAATRARLVAELGVEPGPELRRVHQGILRGDLDPRDPYDAQDTPAPAPPWQPAPAAVPAASVPAQLPRDPGRFTGRLEELARLDAALPAGHAAADAVVVAVAGTAGVGKTTLAVHWAHRVRDRFPDGQLYVNLRGFDPGGQVMSAEDALRGFLDALGVPPQRLPVSPDAQAALYRSLLAGRRMLVVLDNARDAGQVRPLVPGAPGCLVLVTSRNHMPGLVAVDGATPLVLDLPSRDEARQLLADRLGADRTGGEPRAVEQIIARCARLPLALAIVAARAATHPHFPLSLLAKELQESAGRLDALDAEDSIADVRAVFSWSYRALSPAAARLFRQLGLHPGPDISAAAAASLAGQPRARVRPLLAELTRAHLLVEHAPARYAFHDLLRAYATEQAGATDDDRQVGEATYRWLDHYLHTAYTAALLIHPNRDPVTLQPAHPRVTPETPADRDGAMGWFGAEHPVLLAAVYRAATAGLDVHTWQLAWTLVDFLHRRGHWQDQLATQRAAVAAARRLGDHRAQARAHNNLAHAYLRLGRTADADEALRQALDLYRTAGDGTGQAHIHLVLAEAWDQQGRHEEALDHSRQALDLYRASGYRYGPAFALNNVGWHLTMLGRHREAIGPCEQALALHQEHLDTGGEAFALEGLGHAHHHLGDHARAIGCYERALELFRRIGNRYEEAGILGHLGDCRLAAGDPDAARTGWRQALAILDELGHPDAAAVRARLGAHA